MDERNAKLLQTLSEATDMLAKADEMQARIADASLRRGKMVVQQKFNQRPAYRIPKKPGQKFVEV